MWTDSRQRPMLWLTWLAAIMPIAGCSVFNTEPLIDSRRDEQGNIVVLDTPRMWRDWIDETDWAVRSELAGERPGGGIMTWDENWRRVIKANSDRENAAKYIDYLIDARRRAGLPDLEGHRLVDED